MKSNKTPKKVPSCRDCGNFCGINPSRTDGAPPAYCSPHGSNQRTPCMPWEDASRKICYIPQK